MSPYTYVLNNPVSLVDPTGHSAKCGGAYQPNFNTQTWRLIFYGAFLWRQWPMKHQLGPGERSENGLTFVLSLEFTDPSGGRPFRNWWEDRDLTPEELRKVETAYRLLKLWEEKWDPAPERAVGVQVKKWNPQYKDPADFKLEVLGEEALAQMMNVMTELIAKATVIEGTIAVGTDENGDPILEHVTLEQILTKVLTSSDKFTIMLAVPTLDWILDRFAESAPDYGGWGGKIGEVAVIAMRSEVFTLGWKDRKDPWPVFLEELFHIYGGPSSPYSREYNGGRDPETDINNGGWIRYRPQAWR